MFACIYYRSVSGSPSSLRADTENPSTLVELAFTFSPLIEQTTADTVVLGISGQDLLFGGDSREVSAAELITARNMANEILRRAKDLELEINVAVAANPDAAIHAARSFKQTTIIRPNEELAVLGNLSIKTIDYSLAGIDAKRVGEIQETFALWGIRTFGDLARLPLAGMAERLGQDGVQLQKLAQGKTDRQLILVQAPIGFQQSLELEYPIAELEPLSFILSRLLNQLCANLNEYALATNEVRLRLVSEPRRVGIASGSNTNSTNTGDNANERTLTLPVPMRNPKTLLRLLLFDIEAHPPSAPIRSITISAEPIKPRESQTGLFIPLAPEPERLEITLARLAKLVGADNVGSPEILDTHRPDTFRMRRFALNFNHRGHRGRNPKAGINTQSTIDNRQCVMGFRIFRPPWIAEVQTIHGQPTRISAHNSKASSKVRGQIVCASGPWRASGDWWRSDVWARDEWDVAVIDSTSRESEVLCRIYRDLTSEQWFVEGIYD